MLLVPNPRILCIVDNNRDAIKAWVNGILASTQLTATKLAEHSGVHQTTLTRFLKSPKSKHTLSLKSVAKIAASVGIEPLADPTRAAIGRSGGSSEAVPSYDATDPRYAEVHSAVRAILSGRRGIEAWTLRVRSLEAAGYLPGDVLIVDMHKRQRPGDAVCAEIHQRRGDTGETVFRLYEPPYLVPATFEDNRRPIVVDDDLVVLRGVVVLALKPRRVT